MPVDLKPNSRMLDTALLVEGGTEYFDIWEPIVFPVSEDDTVYKVTQTDLGRLDVIAYRYYNDPNLWWVIAHVNKIEDIFEEILPGTKLRIPSYSTVRLILNRLVG